MLACGDCGALHSPEDGQFEFVMGVSFCPACRRSLVLLENGRIEWRKQSTGEVVAHCQLCEEQDAVPGSSMCSFCGSDV